RVRHDVLAEEIGLRLNLLDTEAARLQLHDRAFHFTPRLPLQQIGRQLPVGVRRELADDLPTNFLLLVVTHAPLEVAAHRLAQFFFRREAAKLMEERLTECRQFLPLDLESFDLDREFLPGEILTRNFVANFRGAGAAITRFGSDHQLIEAFQGAVWEDEAGP